MRELTLTLLDSILKAASIRPRLRQELRLSPHNVEDWGEVELFAVQDRAGRKGVLIIELSGRLYAVEHELTSRVFDRQSGRTKPIICDFCCTWQSASGVGRITFLRKSDQHSVTFLCCADLRCSDHVRNKTHRSQLSRTHLREDLTTEQRVDRLRIRLDRLIDTLELRELSI